MFGILKKSVALAVAATLGNALYADWKITTVVKSSTGESAQTEYFKGQSRRTDQTVNIDGRQSEFIDVLDFDRLRQTIWDTNRREYVVYRLKRPAPGTFAPAAPELIIDRITTDTGERRTYFGRVARHLVTQEKLNGAGIGTDGSRERTTEIGGWYVDSDSLPRWVRGRGVYFLAASGARPNLKLNQIGPALKGLPVWERQVSSSILPSGHRETYERTLEVTELVEAPLPDELFAPPPGFNRVVSFPSDVPLPWLERLRLEWERLEDWFEGTLL